MTAPHRLYIMTPRYCDTSCVVLGTVAKYDRTISLQLSFQSGHGSVNRSHSPGLAFIAVKKWETDFGENIFLTGTQRRGWMCWTGSGGDCIQGSQIVFSTFLSPVCYSDRDSTGARLQPQCHPWPLDPHQLFFPSLPPSPHPTPPT